MKKSNFMKLLELNDVRSTSDVEPVDCSRGDGVIDSKNYVIWLKFKKRAIEDSRLGFWRHHDFDTWICVKWFKPFYIDSERNKGATKRRVDRYMKKFNIWIKEHCECNQ